MPDWVQGGLKLPPIRSQEELQTALTRLGSLRPDQVCNVSSILVALHIDEPRLLDTAPVLALKVTAYAARVCWVFTQLSQPIAVPCATLQIVDCSG